MQLPRATKSWVFLQRSITSHHFIISLLSQVRGSATLLLPAVKNWSGLQWHKATDQLMEIGQEHLETIAENRIY